jgi:hypothetical protein
MHSSHGIGLWDDCLASIAEQLPRAAPTSGSAPPDAVAATVDSVSNPAGNAAGAAFPAAIAVLLPRCHSDIRQTSSIDPASPHLPVAELPQAVADDGLSTPGHIIDLWHKPFDLWQYCLKPFDEQLPRVTPTSGSASSNDRLVASAPADAVATVNAVSGDVNVVVMSVVPAGNAAGADVRADVLVAYQAAYRAVRFGLDPEPCHAHLIGLWQDYLAPIAKQLPNVAPTSAFSALSDRLSLLLLAPHSESPCLHCRYRFRRTSGIPD